MVQVRCGFGFPQVALTCATCGGCHLTLAYITKRLSEEEEKKERHLVGGRIALLIYSEGRGLHTSNPLPFPAPSSRVCLLHQPSPALGHRLPSPAAYYRLPPPSPPRARPWALTTGFHRLPPPCAPLGRDNREPAGWITVTPNICGMLSASGSREQCWVQISIETRRNEEE